MVGVARSRCEKQTMGALAIFLVDKTLGSAVGIRAVVLAGGWLAGLLAPPRTLTPGLL